MKKIILLSLISLINLSAFAQHHRPSFEEFQQKKLEYIVKEMGLNESEAEKFTPLYKELISERAALYGKYHQNIRIKKEMREGKSVADTTMQRISRDDANIQVEDAQLEQKYQQKFETILSPQQVCKWREAEQKFRTDIMRRRPRH